MQKLTSRKFWLALLGSIVGIVALFGGPAMSEELQVQVATAIAGAATIILSALGYFKAEKDVDVARVNSRAHPGPGEGPDVLGITLLIQERHPDWTVEQITAELRRFQLIPEGADRCS